MNIKKLLCVALMAFGLMNSTVVLAEQPPSPIKVQFGWDEDKMSGMKYGVVYITAIDDNVVLKGITVNRSNCRESLGNRQMPVKLPFGQGIPYKYMKCEILEAEILTNTGTWTFR